MPKDGIPTPIEIDAHADYKTQQRKARRQSALAENIQQKIVSARKIKGEDHKPFGKPGNKPYHASRAAKQNSWKFWIAEANHNLEIDSSVASDDEDSTVVPSY